MYVRTYVSAYVPHSDGSASEVCPAAANHHLRVDFIRHVEGECVAGPIPIQAPCMYVCMYVCMQRLLLLFPVPDW